MIQFNLISGFLGSGKTTLLQNLLTELAPKHKIAVIQNEFAPTGFDGKELKRTNDDFHLVEINNGSVFCVCQLGSFEKTMLELIEVHQPEMIFLEASGLADPISIIELLDMPSLANKVRLNQIVSMVDAPNFVKGLNKLVRFKHQLMIADTIIVNKTDLFTADLNDINQQIKELNPYATIEKTSYAKVNWEAICQSNTGKAAAQYQGHASGGRPEELNACVLRSHNKIEELKLLLFVKELQEICPRIKGYVNLCNRSVLMVNSVFNNLQTQIIYNYVGPSEIIAFGHKLNVISLRKLFKKYTE